MLRKTFSFFFSILLIEMVVLILILPGCKGRSPVLPILPPESNPTSGQLPPTNDNHRSISGSRSNARLIMTGPKEYLSSELDPPLITQSQPTFSAIVENLTIKPNPDDFVARIDMKDVPCDIDPLTNEVRFTPMFPLESGNHFAILRFWNPEGTSAMLWWSFRIETSPPGITGVMWSTKNDYAAVFFDREVEPSRAIDPNRWMVNAGKDIFRDSIKRHLGGVTVFLPLTPDIFEIYQTDLPMTITYIDVNGPADYVIRRGGSMREGQAITCSEGNEEYCRSITADIFSHNSIQTEEHAVGYYLEPDEETLCPLRIEFTNWSMAPTLNDNPKSPGSYYQQQDNSTIGEFEPVGDYYEVLPLNQTRWSRTYLTFLRRYKHTLTVTLRADCDRDSVFETVLGQQSFILQQGEVGVDSNPPQFLFPPTVLYGDEAATIIRQLVGNAPMSGEGCLTCNEYYFAIYRDEFERQMNEMAANTCDLYIVTQATDDFGLSNPWHFCLDKLMSDASVDYGTTSQGEGGTNVLVCDYAPFASLVDCSGCASMNCYNCELDCAWGDPRHRPCGGPPYIGGILKQDWCPEEGTITWWRLEDELGAPPGEEVVGMKVRVADNAAAPEADPEPGITGNWRRSDDVINQLCGPFGSIERGGGSARELQPCRGKLRVEFVDKNPSDHSNNPEQYYKLVEFENECDEGRYTNFIYGMKAQQGGRWGAIVHIAAKLDLSEHPDPCEIPESIKVKILNCEETHGSHEDSVDVVLTRYDLASYPYISLDELAYLFGIRSKRTYEPEEPREPVCELCFYIGKVFITDSEDTNEDTGTLYMSNSDNLLPSDQQKDYAFSIVKGFCDEFKNIVEGFFYGTGRGIGWDKLERDEVNGKDKWYGFEGFIQSGGFEIIMPKEAYHLKDETKFSIELDTTTYGRKSSVPIQSQSDVIILIGHSFLHGNDENDRWTAPLLHDFYFPLHSNWWGSTENCDHKSYTNRTDYFVFNQACNYGYGNDETDPENCNSRCYYRNDFVEPYSGQTEATFWKKERGSGSDTKWLLVLSCATLHNRIGKTTPVLGPNTINGRMKLRNLIDAGYFDSVCGFRDQTNIILFEALLPWYNARMSQLPNMCNPCCVDTELYESPEFYPPDPSIAAFMESCAQLAQNSYYRVWHDEEHDKDIYNNANKACAIAKVNGHFYSWHIKRVIEYEFDKSINKIVEIEKWKITRLELYEDPAE